MTDLGAWCSDTEEDWASEPTPTRGEVDAARAYIADGLAKLAARGKPGDSFRLAFIAREAQSRWCVGLIDLAGYVRSLIG